MQNVIKNLKRSLKKVIYSRQFGVITGYFSACFFKRNWIKSTLLFCRIIKIFNSNRLVNIYFRYIGLIIRRMVAYKKLSYIDIKKAWLNLFHSCNDDMKMLISKLFFAAGIIDDEISAAILDFAKNTHNKAYRYWTTMDISFATFGTQKGMTEDYYALRKDLLKQIATENSFTIPEVTSKSNNKLCIIVYHLEPSLTNSLFRVTKMITDGLTDHFDEIAVLVLDSFLVSRKDSYLSSILSYSFFNSKKYADMNQKLLGDKIKIIYSDGDNYQSRMQDFMSKLYSENPRMIIDVSDEFSPLSYYYTDDFFTFYIPLRSGGSSSFYTRISGPKWQYEEPYCIGNCVDTDKVVGWIFPEYIMPFEGTYSRKMLGLADDSFIIITVAYCSKNACDTFLEEISQLLMRNEKMIWIILADIVPDYIYVNHPDLVAHHKIISREYDSNLYALYKICNVLLRTDSTGGSGSTAIAAMAKLPIVLSTYFCDPMTWLGKDYTHLKTYHEMMLEIEHLYNDNEYYKKRSLITQKLVQKALNSQSHWDLLYNILNEEMKKLDHVRF